MKTFSGFLIKESIDKNFYDDKVFGMKSFGSYHNEISFASPKHFRIRYYDKRFEEKFGGNTYTEYIIEYDDKYYPLKYNRSEYKNGKQTKNSDFSKEKNIKEMYYGILYFHDPRIILRNIIRICNKGEFGIDEIGYVANITTMMGRKVEDVCYFHDEKNFERRLFVHRPDKPKGFLEAEDQRIRHIIDFNIGDKNVKFENDGKIDIPNHSEKTIKTVNFEEDWS